jgi:hypothetical protein
MPNFSKLFTITPSYQGPLNAGFLSEKFKKAFAFTGGWEGPWDGGNKPLRDSKNKFTNDVAAYGLTPLFLKDFVGTPDKNITLAYMKSINSEKAAIIWQASRWLWYKCEMIASDEIGILIFDWAVRKPDIVAEEMAKAVGLSLRDCEHPYLMNLGGNPASKTDGFYYPSVTIIDRINEACKIDGQYNQAKIQKMYENLIVRRIVTESGVEKYVGVARRLGCLLFGEWSINVDSFNSLPAARQKQIVDGVKKLRNKGLKVQKQAQLDADTEGAYGTYIAGAFALWIGIKWFKNRKK